VRDNIPRHLWAAGYGFNQVGNGSTSIPSLLTSGHRLTELNIRLLQQCDLENLDDLDTGFQAESLLCWAKMAVRINAAMLHYRESVLALLRAEGHALTIYLPASKGKSSPEKQLKDNQESLLAQQQLTDAIQAVREENYQAECEAIAAATELPGSDYQVLKKRLVKSPQERRAMRKFEIQARYGLTVTTELVSLDDQGWYQKLRLHYFLTVGRSFLADRDTKIAKLLIEQGHGSLFLPDFNRSQLGAAIGTMEVLGLKVLLANPQRELCPLDSDLQALANIAIQNRADIKNILGIGIAKNASPITIVRRCLEQIGYGLILLKTRKINRKTVRIYQLVSPQDGRELVFQRWLERDRQLPGSSEGWFEDNWPQFQQASKSTEMQTPYVQLSLALD
jgi:hypothetical protein